MEIYQLVPILTLSINICITNILIMITLDPANNPVLDWSQQNNDFDWKEHDREHENWPEPDICEKLDNFGEYDWGGPDTGHFKHNMGRVNAYNVNGEVCQLRHQTMKEKRIINKPSKQMHRRRYFPDSYYDISSRMGGRHSSHNMNQYYDLHPLKRTKKGK